MNKQLFGDMLFILKRLEFMYYLQKGNTIIKVCPICKNEQHRQHKEDCVLKNIIKQAVESEDNNE